MNQCPICGAKTKLFYSGLYDDRYGFPGTFKLYRCESCAHVSSDFRPADEQVTELYSRYYPRKNLSETDWAPSPPVSGFKAWLDGLNGGAYAWVPERVSVLDVGSGAGEAVGYHKERGCEAYGIDPDQNVQKIAAAHKLNIKSGVFDKNAFPPQTFDFVTMDQVIEHFSDPVDVMRAAHVMLKPGGTLVMTTPNYRSFSAHLFGRRWINWHIPYHIQFFSKKSMEAAARRSGFELERVVHRTHSAWTFFQWIHVFTIPREGAKSHFWSVGEKRPFYVKAVMGAAYILHLMRVTHVTARILDACGMGDNFVFICRKV